MRERDSKSSLFLADKKRRIFPLIFMVISLCGLSFYLGGAFCWEKSRLLDENKGQNDASKVITRLGCQSTFKQEPFPECNTTMQDSTPCTDPERWKKYDIHRMAFRERHCPPQSERTECLIPPPVGYKVPIPWPKSRDECWYRNVPYDWINTQKANQNWLKKKGEKFLFPGGGTMFPNGVGEYLDQMQELIPEMKDGRIRTALDTGCGVASWGGGLLDRGILTMSLAPRDNHEAQVQFALERGIPAILGIISTQRLPYPANAFDMAHCSRCLIPWAEFGGVLLLEIDRVLRPGGFWVLSGPPINYQVHWKGWESTEETQKANLDAIQDLLSRMCYSQYAMEGDIAVWQKPVENSCYENREPLTLPPICDDSIEPDAAWYVPIRPCIVPRPPGVQNVAIEHIPRWPERLSSPPERLKFISGGNGGAFRTDTTLWKQRVNYYRSLVPTLGSNKIRNVMDMNTLYGGFAAALLNDPVWVMNVVSSYAVNSLGVVYDRGLIGTVHDWCEAFSTYPRTYDLLHADGLFDAESHRCEMKFVMLEIDRILRPTGYAIIRDTANFLDKAQVVGEAMRWNCHRNETENGSEDSKALLVCQKSFWNSPQMEDRDVDQ
ncbi:hypothetical protein O6H91_16G091300 [Diphasiastrum complanatum]|nr:hypothetical protein O6H91_16G091300 [Diphasiastrum complanatum]KAJ7528247.1 hypothetical protein O6H91_16G091300 [Diphasiastrum complanatum]KAJ7528248.1 hypothetical protein O6H91_16G091300 [Diphasiastrum complanatum]KAJ7528249.1 hypothetical protein O6H91_16G091300 [Diphasiastrum complanatum]KAJ7528251.1 hypothetical protein O6H91_16G091300 [Diphasiastrum complanatum]